MKDEIVTYPTAKLAKEKGFDWNILHSYRDGILDFEEHFEGTISEMYFNANDINRTKFKEVLSAPTQSLLQRWLREVHSIDCLVHLNMNNEYSCHIYKNHLSINKDKDIWKGEGIIPNGKKYEDVLEEGLQEALKLVPNETKTQ